MNSRPISEHSNTMPTWLIVAVRIATAVAIGLWWVPVAIANVWTYSQRDHIDLFAAKLLWPLIGVLAFQWPWPRLWLKVTLSLSYVYVVVWPFQDWLYWRGFEGC